MPEPSPQTTVRIAPSRGTVIAAAIFAVLMLGLLTAQMLMIEDQRSTTDAQLRTAVRQANANLPLVKDAQPLVERIANDAPQIARFGRDANVLMKELTPLADQLLDADAPGAARAVRQLAVTLLEADVPRAASDLGRITNELLEQQRLRRLLVRTNAVLGEVRARHLVRKTARAAEVTTTSFPRTIQLQEELLATQKQALAAIAETLSVAKEVRDVAKETERHAESLDRKTGGPAPTAAGTTAP